MFWNWLRWRQQSDRCKKYWKFSTTETQTISPSLIFFFLLYFVYCIFLTFWHLLKTVPLLTLFKEYSRKLYIEHYNKTRFINAIGLNFLKYITGMSTKLSSDKEGCQVVYNSVVMSSIYRQVSFQVCLLTGTWILRG